MNPFINWRDHVGSRPEKFYKATLWHGSQVTVGMNCLEPGQTQPVHAHEGSDKFYVVLEGSGKFTVGDHQENAGEGMLIVAPAGLPHGVTNIGKNRLSLLVGIAPPIG